MSSSFFSVALAAFDSFCNDITEVYVLDKIGLFNFQWRWTEQDFHCFNHHVSVRDTCTWFMRTMRGLSSHSQFEAALCHQSLMEYTQWVWLIHKYYYTWCTVSVLLMFFLWQWQSRSKIWKTCTMHMYLNSVISSSISCDSKHYCEIWYSYLAYFHVNFREVLSEKCTSVNMH